MVSRPQLWYPTRTWRDSQKKVETICSIIAQHIISALFDVVAQRLSTRNILILLTHCPSREEQKSAKGSKEISKVILSKPFLRWVKPSNQAWILHEWFISRSLQGHRYSRDAIFPQPIHRHILPGCLYDIYFQGSNFSCILFRWTNITCFRIPFPCKTAHSWNNFRNLVWPWTLGWPLL